MEGFEPRSRSETEPQPFAQASSGEGLASFEREPNNEEFKMLELANSVVASEMQLLGVSDKAARVFPFPVARHELHIALPGHPQTKNIEGGHIDHLRNGQMMLTSFTSEHFHDMAEQTKKAFKFVTILHETIHRAGFSSRNPDGTMRRIGYMQTNTVDDAERNEHLRQLNEGIVEYLTRRWALQHMDEIRKTLGDVEESDFDVVKTFDSYDGELALLENVVQAIAKANDEDPNAVYARMAAGQFTGEMMHLRDIEKVFGQGRLRYIGTLPSA